MGGSDRLGGFCQHLAPSAVARVGEVISNQSLNRRSIHLFAFRLTHNNAVMIKTKHVEVAKRRLFVLRATRDLVHVLASEKELRPT